MTAHAMAAQPCMKEPFTNRPKYQNIVAYKDDAHVDPKIVHED